MRGFKVAVGLLAAVLLHALGVFVFGDFPRAVDLFLVVAVFNALDGNLPAAMIGGMVAGLLADTFSGGLFGLNGLADTIIGYGAAFASQRLVIQRAAGVLLFFGLAASLQQAITMGLSVFLLPDPPLPESSAIALRVAVTSLVGVAGFFGHRRFLRGLKIWRRNRGSRLK